MFLEVYNRRALLRQQTTTHDDDGPDGRTKSKATSLPKKRH